MSTFIAPTLLRRVASSLYEFTLLFGIAFATAVMGIIGFQLIGHQIPTWLLQTMVFLVFGFYFSHSWKKSGQTLAQRTWHIKTISLNQQPLSTKQAWLRYTLAYLGVLPALLFSMVLIQQNPQNIKATIPFAILMLVFNWLTLLGTSLLNPERQALHERISRTRSILIPPK